MNELGYSNAASTGANAKHVGLMDQFGRAEKIVAELQEAVMALDQQLTPLCSPELPGLGAELIRGGNHNDVEPATAIQELTRLCARVESLTQRVQSLRSRLCV